MATKKPPKKPRVRTPRPKQQYLDPDMAPPSIPELDQAADLYYDRMEARLPYTKAEAEAKDSVREIMLARGLKKYVTPDGLECEATGTTKVSVKRKKEKVSENGQAEE